MKIGIIAAAIHRHGGMERAAAEVFERVAVHHKVMAFSTDCELTAPNVTHIPIKAISRPAILRHESFRRQVRALETETACTITNSIGAAAIDADVITAQFCHAAFTDRSGGLRGGTNLLRRRYQNWAQQVYTDQERHAYTSARLKRVIAVSCGVKRELMQYYGLADAKIVVIPNAVDHRVFHPAANAEVKLELRRQLGLPESHFLALFVGGDWDRKGLRSAIEAIAGLPDTTLVVVGQGDIKRFTHTAALAGVSRNVIFTGRSPCPQDYYAASDAFIFPSQYEAFSLVTLEAAASGLPLIALPINGTEELIEDGVNGFFARPASASFRSLLGLLQADRPRCRAMSEAAVRSSRPYTWDRVASEQMHVFEDADERLRHERRMT
ncbi:MAG: glycosyltransferase family 4 protein [Janthinobacterium lividum]